MANREAVHPDSALVNLRTEVTVLLIVETLISLRGACCAISLFRPSTGFALSKASRSVNERLLEGYVSHLQDVLRARESRTG